MRTDAKFCTAKRIGVLVQLPNHYYLKKTPLLFAFIIFYFFLYFKCLDELDLFYLSADVKEKSYQRTSLGWRLTLLFKQPLCWRNSTKISL